MPVYEYRCTDCSHEFQLLSAMSLSNQATLCLQCKGKATRKVSLFAAMVRGEDGLLEDYSSLDTMGGCGCGGGGGCGCGG